MLFTMKTNKIIEEGFPIVFNTTHSTTIQYKQARADVRLLEHLYGDVGCWEDVKRSE